MFTLITNYKHQSMVIKENIIVHLYKRNGSQVIKAQAWMFSHRTRDLSTLSPTRETFFCNI